MKTLLKIIALFSISISVFSASPYGVMSEELYIEIGDALRANDFETVDKFIEKGLFHPLMQGPYDYRIISSVGHMGTRRDYNSQEEYERATDLVIERYEYLISRGDNMSVPVEAFEVGNSSLNLLQTSVGINNLRIFKFLYEVYGYKNLTWQTESSIYSNGALAMFKYVFFEKKIRKAPHCSALTVTFDEGKLKNLTGYNRKTGARFKGFFQYWDEAGVPYKHCFTTQGERRLYGLE